MAWTYWFKAMFNLARCSTGSWSLARFMWETTAASEATVDSAEEKLPRTEPITNARMSAKTSSYTTRSSPTTSS